MTTANTSPFTRMSGAGNTFFITDYRKDDGHSIARAARPNFVRHICSELVGASTDGVVFIESSTEKGVDFAWDFYNSDGSSAEMCGNAARCAALYFQQKCLPKNNLKFHTKAGLIEAWIIDPKGIVRVQMPQVAAAKTIEVKTDGKSLRTYFVNTGVPHVIIESEPDHELAQRLRHAPEYGPAGTNVTFIVMDDSDFVQAVTFERGVENFTLACGTGAVAAAKFHHDFYPEITSQQIEMPGGLLQVDWEEGQAFLSGPAEFHFDAFFYQENV